MFNGEQPGLATDERTMSLVPILISLLNTYAGLSTAVAGFVLDNTVLVVVGFLLVGSASVLAHLITKVMNRSESARLVVYEKGEQCESFHLSLMPLTPSVKNSAFPDGPLSIRTASMLSPTRRATISGSTSMSSGPGPKVLTALPLPTVS
jgi:NAD(P) transhydrogenase beta subunit